MPCMHGFQEGQIMGEIVHIYTRDEGKLYNNIVLVNIVKFSICQRLFKTKLNIINILTTCLPLVYWLKIKGSHACAPHLLSIS